MLAAKEPTVNDTQDTNPSDAITVINDGDGIALIGDPRVIDQFLSAHGVESRPLDLRRTSGLTATASTVADTAAQVAQNSGRWVKLTAESAAKLKVGTAMTGSTTDVSRAILTSGGKTSHILEFSSKGVGMLANPALLAGAAGIMSQVAMQQAMDEITQYLKAIDVKVDMVIRAQKDAVFADLIGVEMAIEEALAIRESVGLVSDVTWSKVQGSGVTIIRTQAYALRQLAAHADRLENARKIGDIASEVERTAAEVNDWLALIARCVQLHDALGILELDRVLTSETDQLESHRIALRTARTNRLNLIAGSTRGLLTRIDAAAGTANAKVLLHPTSARDVVGSSARIERALVDFQVALGVREERDAIVARKWRDAATELRNRAIESGTAGVEGARRLGGASVERAKQAATGVSAKVTELRAGKPDDADDSE